MPFWRLYYHLVWATKNREPFITPEIEPRLFAYIVNKAAELGAYVYAIDGWTEHTHVVAGVPPQLAISKLVQEIKGASSHDLNQQNLGFKFAWQRGYGVLSLGQTQRHAAECYVRDQKRHHRENSAIPWLERYCEVDEGPEDTGVSRTRVPTIREYEVLYDVLGTPPF